jgi:chemotaxis protein CheX
MAQNKSSDPSFMEWESQLPEFIIESVRETFEKNLSSPADPIEQIPDFGHPCGILCSISFHGAIMGNFAMGISQDNACILISKLLGMEFDSVTSDVTDGVGELVNMMLGGTKTRLAMSLPNFEISVPTIVTGQDLELARAHGAQAVSMGFKTNICDFGIMMIYRPVAEEEIEEPLDETVKTQARDRLVDLIQQGILDTATDLTASPAPHSSDENPLQKIDLETPALPPVQNPTNVQSAQSVNDAISEPMKKLEEMLKKYRKAP